MNNKPITIVGNSQVITGMRIQGKKEAAYEPVMSKSPKRVKYCGYFKRCAALKYPPLIVVPI